MFIVSVVKCCDAGSRSFYDHLWMCPLIVPEQSSSLHYLHKPFILSLLQYRQQTYHNIGLTSSVNTNKASVSVEGS